MKIKCIYRLVLFFVFLFSPGLSGAFQKVVPDSIAHKILVNQWDFEMAGKLNNWKPGKGSIAISSRHFKEGKHSLLWKWKKNGSLLLENLEGLEVAAGMYPGGIPEFFEPAYYAPGRYGGIKMWLYQEKAKEGEMVFQVGSSAETARNNPKYRFRVQLNFTGWRAVWVNFEEDARVESYKGSDKMHSIIAFPAGKANGTGELFIDHFSLLTFVSNKRHSDLQFVNTKKDYRQADSYEILAPYKDYENANVFDSGDMNELARYSNMIAERLELLILGDKTNAWQRRNTGIEKRVSSSIKSAHTFYSSLQLEKRNGFITGVPMFATRDEHPAKEGLVFQAVSQEVTFPLAMDYRLNGEVASKEKLVEVLDYFEDQGWAAGSAMGSVDHVIRLNAIANAIFLIRDELKQQQKLSSRIEMLLWHTRMGNLFNIQYTKGENTDKVRGGAVVKLITILLMDDGPEKLRLLKAFKEYMDYVIRFAPGYSDTMKPDYSVYHHRGTYLNSYGIQSVNTMAMIRWLLEDTPYALSDQSSEILKNALIRHSQIAFGVDLHFGVSGRFPHQSSAIGRFLLPAYAFMSLKGDKLNDIRFAKRFNYLYNITEPTEIISILSPALTYSGTFGTLDLLVHAHEQMKEESSRPEDGHYTMPYSSFSVHRKGNAFSAVKGYNKYIWDFETGSSAGENSLGRYLSFGYLITVQGDEKKGFKGAGIDMMNGYHWGFLPGATTKALPMEEVHFVNKATEKYLEGYHRSFSKTTFANGLSQNGQNGIYAMELRDDVGPDEKMILFDSTFRAKKSYFFIGNEIICLGSDIQNGDKRYSTVTTLFQYKFNKEYPTWYNGMSLGHALTVNRIMNAGYFTDQNGIHYIVQGNSKVVLEQNNQESLRRVDREYEKITSPHVKAYLDHGKSPVAGEYEYQILLNTEKDSLKRFINHKTYEVIQKDAHAHSIFHKTTGTTAYAVFSANKSFTSGPLIKSDTPVLLMFREPGQYSLLTVTNPDIQLADWNHNMSRMPDEYVNAASKGSVVTITLRGEWFAAGAVHDVISINQRDGQTEIMVYCKDGKSIDIPLKKRS